MNLLRTCSACSASGAQSRKLAVAVLAVLPLLPAAVAARAGAGAIPAPGPAEAPLRAAEGSFPGSEGLLPRPGTGLPSGPGVTPLPGQPMGPGAPGLFRKKLCPTNGLYVTQTPGIGMPTLGFGGLAGGAAAYGALSERITAQAPVLSMISRQRFSRGIARLPPCRSFPEDECDQVHIAADA